MDVAYKNFPPLDVKVGDTVFPAHDLAGMKTWFLTELKIFAAKYPIKAIAVTTHGATFVCLDAAGKVSLPCIFYTYEPGDWFQEAFYAKCGSREELQKNTFSPPLGSLVNPSKGIFFMQLLYAEQWKNVHTIINYPSYWSYELTGILGSEPTYLGCHTHLWNHAEQKYSYVADTLGIRNLLPVNYHNSYEGLGKISAETVKATGLSPDTIVTMGIHDSNASLLPYLIRENTGSSAKTADADYVVNSTGSWCVDMHPQSRLEFKTDDIGNIVFFNQSALCKPVKTAIFTGGLELDSWLNLLYSISGSDEFPNYNPAVFQDVIKKADAFIMPEIVHGSGQFKGSVAGAWEGGTFYPFTEIRAGHAPAFFAEREKFWAVLDLSMAVQTDVTLKRAGLENGMRVFTEGGFRKNKGYNALLAQLLSAEMPGVTAFLTSMKEATSYGAAMTALMALNGRDSLKPDSIDITYDKVASGTFAGLDAYKAKWLANCKPR
jgi:sugar (pentulose or hexulose) kinase